MQKITPFLWFDGKTEEAVKLYTSVFKDSKVHKIEYWGEGGPLPANQVMTATFELSGQKFHAFDAGPAFKFTEAISMFVECKDQEEVDYYWNALTAGGGQESQCGWLKDKFGLSWQIVPKALPDYLSGEDKAKAGRVMQAMMKMKKIIVADLDKAAEAK
ncbi:MAG TPA: VOC family protein [Chitinophagaceae bacterium]|jgi:predicted 3-demethylubiquinone-9 3-methyltransferase (glyoxalase superfamily)|nr:VOC family protein [Chitinophagaceae bacterium]